MVTMIREMVTMMMMEEMVTMIREKMALMMEETYGDNHKRDDGIDDGGRDVDIDIKGDDGTDVADCPAMSFVFVC